MDKNNNTGYCNTGDHNTGNYNSGYYNSGNYSTGDCNSGNYNTGNYNSGYYNSGNYNSGYYNRGNYNSGDCNSGNYNTGNCNSGHRNSGLFNTDEPKARLFNKECDYTLTELYEAGLMPYINLSRTKWVPTNEMTAAEKKKHAHKAAGGYLKTLTYHEAWAEFWANTDEATRKKFLDLPNFDAAIFEEITGIDVTVKPKPGRKVKIRLAEGTIVEGEILDEE